MNFLSTSPLRLALILLPLALILWLGVRAVGAETVAVTQPVRGPAVQAVYATGTVEATIMMPIAPRISARLIALNKDEGANVAKGEILAELESEDLKAGLNDLKAREAYALQEYQRYAKLVRTNAASKATYQRARADWDSARAAVAKGAAELGYTQLTAPA